MRSLMPIYTLLLAIFLFMTGTGVLPAVIGLRLDTAGVSAPLIGLLGTGYFAGLTIGSIMAFGLIQRVGHIRAFAAFVSMASASVLAYALVQNVPLWLVLRVVNGFCVAGVFVCLESWLNDQADPASRGSTLAWYMVALYAGQALSQMTLSIDDGNRALPFVIGTIVLSLTVLPVAMTRMAEPPRGGQDVLKLKTLYGASPLGLVGTVAVGVMLGAFYIMAPIHAQRIGLTNLETASLIGLAIAGGTALQWPLGWLSDRFDRRKVIVASFALTASICVGLALVGASPALSLLGAAFGGFAFALYPLCVAHTHDHIEKWQRTGASGGLVLCYSAGAALGPLLSAEAMRLFGPSGLYWFIGAVAALTFVFGIGRQLAAPPVPADDQGAFQVLPRTTPASAALDNAD